MKEIKQEVIISKKEFYKNLARLALPIALQSLMLASVAAGDALMLGKVAQDETCPCSNAIGCANGDPDRSGERISYGDDGDYVRLYDRTLRQYRHNQRSAGRRWRHFVRHV